MKGKRVLIVDDNEAVLTAVAMLVTGIGHLPETALDGARALVALEFADFDVVLTDLLMPGMNGDQLALEIRRRKPALPVLLMSGNPPRDGTFPDIARTLTKPFSLIDLRNAIAEVCPLA